MLILNRYRGSKRTYWSLIMARAKIGLGGKVTIESTPKVTRQGSSKNTKYAATSRNNAKKRYRGQGR